MYGHLNSTILLLMSTEGSVNQVSGEAPSQHFSVCTTKPAEVAVRSMWPFECYIFLTCNFFISPPPSNSFWNIKHGLWVDSNAYVLCICMKIQPHFKLVIRMQHSSCHFKLSDCFLISSSKLFLLLGLSDNVCKMSIVLSWGWIINNEETSLDETVISLCSPLKLQ